MCLGTPVLFLRFKGEHDVSVIKETDAFRKVCSKVTLTWKSIYNAWSLSLQLCTVIFSKYGFDWFSTGLIFQRKQKTTKIVLNHKKEQSFCAHKRKWAAEAAIIGFQ